MTTPSLDSFFSGGGGQTLSWKDVPIGTTYTGVITSIGEPQQATDPATKLPAVTRQGKPRNQVRIGLKTDYRDPTDPEDDGGRNLYCGGWMTGAIGDAMRKAGVEPKLQIGATLSVRLTEREPNGPGIAPTNKFDAHYVPPSPAGDFFSGQPQAQQQLAPLGAPQQFIPPVAVPQQAFTAPPLQSPVEDAPPWAQAPVQQQVAPQQAPVAQPPVMTPEQVAAFMAQQVPAAPAAAEPPKPAAISDQAWAAMPPETKVQVAKTMSAMPSM